MPKIAYIEKKFQKATCSDVEKWTSSKIKIAIREIRHALVFWPMDDRQTQDAHDDMEILLKTLAHRHRGAKK